MKEYSLLEHKELKEIMEDIKEVREYALNRGIKPEEMEVVITYYLKSFYQAVWILDRRWNQIKDKYIKFVHKFFPKAKIYQNEQRLVLELPDILDFLERRLVLDGLMFLDGKQESEEEAQKILTEFRNRIKHYLEARTHTRIGVTPYLATIDLGGIGGDLAVLWRTGDVTFAMSGDYDTREESLIDIISKAYFTEHKH